MFGSSKMTFLSTKSALFDITIPKNAYHYLIFGRQRTETSSMCTEMYRHTLYKIGNLARQRMKEFQKERNARDRKLKVGSHPITHKLFFGPLWRGRGLEQ
jgi:hypothetical protein